MKHLQPRIHMRPPRYWINDPNGPVYWQGRYHLFFQYNPHGPEWGNIHWGHAVSEDLVRWEFLPEALKPGPEEYDRDGIFSGGAIVRGEDLYLFYTGANPQTQCLAVSDGMGGFRKHPSNPLIDSPPPGYETPDFRDPFVWKAEDGYCLIVASAYQGRGIIFLYESDDLISWQFRSEFYSEELPADVPAFECPLYFSLAGKDVLVISPYNSPFYLTGIDTGLEFRPEVWGQLDPNPHWYAPNTLLTRDGRRIIIAWHQEERPVAAQARDGWSGCMSIPRELKLNEDGSIAQRPVAEMSSLRESGHPFSSAGDLGRLPAAAELELSLRAPRTGEWEIRLCENRERTSRFSVFIGSRTVRLEDTLSGREARVTAKSADLPSGSYELKLRLFLDGSVVELFINDSIALSSRLYPESADHRYATIHPPSTDSGEVKGMIYGLAELF